MQSRHEEDKTGESFPSQSHLFAVHIFIDSHKRHVQQGDDVYNPIKLVNNARNERRKPSPAVSIHRYGEIAN